jgi:hypothetical protein
MELRIRQDWLAMHNNSSSTKLTIEKVEVKNYFGTYDGRIAVELSPWAAGIGRGFILTVAGHNFVLFDIFDMIWIWDNGEVTCFEAAYEKGWLTEQDISRLWHNHYMDFPNRYR